jgi:GNAT superfamily N-acetyltransferase
MRLGADAPSPPLEVNGASNERPLAGSSVQMTAVHYRKADLADVPRLSRLPREGEAGGDSADRMSRYLAGVHHPQQALPPRAMWIATEGESPIGYVAGHLTRRFGCDGELQWIYVVAEHRRARVASGLLHLLAEWFLEHGARRVCVDVGDDSARPFYRRHGARDLNRHWMVWNDIGAVIEGSTAAT